MTSPSPLGEARAREAALRGELAAAVAERARAAREAERLEGRAALEGADPAVAAAAPGSKPASGLSAHALVGGAAGGRASRVSMTGWLRVGLALEWSWLAAGIARPPASSIAASALSP